MSGHDPQRPLKVGVIGCGLIAKVMHLPYMAEMPDRFEIAALCDISPNVLEECARRYGVSKTFSDWEQMLEEPLDAILVLTPVSHAPPALAAMERGMSVLVE
ncbi:MAG: Gfo/Idh/MocA family protein [Ilumatobacteraceae bacterium]